MSDIQLQDEAWEGIEDGTEALLDEWHVKEGDSVTAGQIVANVIVAKTTFEVASPAAGKITKLNFAEQDSFARGAAIATLGD